MSFFDQQFDASKVAPSTAFTPLPEGSYKVHVKTCIEEKTKDGRGLMLKAELAILDPAQFKGRVIFHRMTLKNSSPQAMEIGQAQLSAFCRGTGVMTPKAAGQFVGKMLTVKVKVEKRKDNGELANRIDGVVLPDAPAVAQQTATSASAAVGEDTSTVPWA